MRVLPTLCRAPDGGAAGAGEISPAAASTSTASTGAASAGTGAPAGEISPAGALGLFDAAGDAPPEASAKGTDGKPARPEWLPEQFWDPEAGAPKVEALGKSWRDLRAQISRGEHKPPPKPEAYALPKVEGLPDGLIGGKDDALWPAIQKAAHGAGLTQQQLEAVAKPYLSAMAEAAAKGPPPPDPEAQKAAMETELAKLGTGGRQVVRDVGGWINGLHAKGILSDTERQALRVVGTADGVRALAKLRELAGEKPIPTTAFAEDGGLAQADAERLLVEGFQTSDQEKIGRARRALEDLQRTGKLIPRR